MTLAQKVSAYVELWRMALPHVEPPTVQDAARWSSYDPALVEKSILRTARRFAADKLTPAFRPDEAYRYVSSVARGESKEHGS